MKTTTVISSLCAMSLSMMSLVSATSHLSQLQEREQTLMKLRGAGLLPDLSITSSDADKACRDIAVQEDFDLNAFLGRWYIHQQAENRFQTSRQNFCTMAEYSLKEGTEDEVNVFNYGHINDVKGEETSVRLQAVVKSNAKLAVGPKFLPKFFYGPYWVVAYDEDEGYALIISGQPQYPTRDGLCSSKDPMNSLPGKGLWIFSRSPVRDEQLIKKVRQIAVQKGIDPDVLIDTPQEGCTYPPVTTTTVEDETEPKDDNKFSILSSSNSFLKQDFEKPWFCHENDCPEYVVDKEEISKEYELRNYKESYWVSTIVSGVDYDKATSMGFMTLFDYISGANEDEVKIPMTSPVRVVVTPGAGPFCESNFTISFYAPYEQQKDPSTIPVPTAENTFIEKIKAMDYYVKDYGGFSNEKVMLDQAINFATDLANDGKEFVSTTFITAAYDPPFRLTDRHNEIWIEKA